MLEGTLVHNCQWWVLASMSRLITVTHLTLQHKYIHPSCTFTFPTYMDRSHLSTRRGMYLLVASMSFPLSLKSVVLWTTYTTSTRIDTAKRLLMALEMVNNTTHPALEEEVVSVILVMGSSQWVYLAILFQPHLFTQKSTYYNVHKAVRVVNGQTKQSLL